LVIFRVAFPSTPQEAGVWLSDETRKRAVLFALQVAPFAGIAFLWFIAVIRDRMGEKEDRFFASVFLGSGLLFIAMFFAAIAVAVGLQAARYLGDDVSDTNAFGMLRALRAQGRCMTLAVGVLHADSLAQVIKSADVVVDSPACAKAIFEYLVDKRFSTSSTD
jgi:hypothetical protein